jgi:hypothetical protein
MMNVDIYTVNKNVKQRGPRWNLAARQKTYKMGKENFSNTQTEVDYDDM